MFSQSKKASTTVIMAASVAVLAIVGMVLSLSSPSTDGAQVWVFPDPQDTLTYKDSVGQSNWQFYDPGEDLGIQVAQGCIAANPANMNYGAETTKCCSWHCTDACASPVGDDTCAEHCAAKCRNYAARELSNYVNTR